MHPIRIEQNVVMGNKELTEILAHALKEVNTQSDREKYAQEKEALGPPASVSFQYRNHPHLLRMTRLRANRHGEQTSKEPDRAFPSH
jgi:hypothetical protein